MFDTSEKFLNAVYSLLLLGENTHDKKDWKFVTNEVLSGAVDADMESVFMALCRALTPIDALHIILDVVVDSETKELREMLEESKGRADNLAACLEEKQEMYDLLAAELRVVKGALTRELINKKREVSHESA